MYSFIFLSSKITSDGDCSHEIKRHLLLGRKAMINLDSILINRDIIFLGPKITADGDCSHEIKRHLLLGRKAMTKLDSVLKGRNITLPTKACIVKAIVFPVVVYGCESWTVRRLSAEELMLLNCDVREDS